MNAAFNGLTPAEAERLAMLAEECAEVIQAVGKILRHGYSSRHPSGGVDNRELLLNEVNDTLGVIHGMLKASDFPADGTNHILRAGAWQKKLRYAHHQGNAS